MSIFAYTGLPGSGKSYGVVANQILPALKAGRVVVTNIPLYEDRIREQVTTGELREFPMDLVCQQPESIDDYAPHGCVLIMDELWKIFPAGQKVDKVPQPFKRLLAEHRHMVDAQGRSTQIVFVTQDLAQVGMFARQLVEQTFVHTKLGHLGADGSFRVRIFHGPATGSNPPQSNQIRMTLGRYEEKIFRLYKSHTMSKAEGDDAQEKSVDTRGNVWKRPGILAAGVACLLALWWAGGTLADIFGRDEVASAPSGASGATAAGAPSSRLVARRIGTAPARSFRVAAVFASNDPANAWAVLVDDKGAEVWIPAGDCMQSRLEWRCEYERQWWTLKGIWRPAVEDQRPRFAVPSLGAGG
ncbi:MAG TPA: zonular occludens toxin domain-containing protein [Povalibacter sp.]|uniref:zonular occludens toxin domain-containing protein n=1 Tax=Povalibacter sp. TaxID=1962978 RepID=UPI002CDCA0A7|nr:zonular occludens toxin domain-containing protein [Povalibacter sp.]HMN47466.1 zonular occludens toxin domain-containing protein [Povalibacter sp.]